MQRTISIKIEAPKGFQEYLEDCSNLFNKYVEWCFEKNTYNKKKAHEELYEKFKEEYPSLPTAIIQSIRDTALEAVKALKFKFKPKKKPLSSVRYDQRTISLRGNKLSIGWSGNRIKKIIKIPEFFKNKYKECKFQSATIGWDKQNKCIKANLIFDIPKPEILNEKKIVGVDRGLYNIVSLSNGFKYASNMIRAFKRKILFLKRQLQAKGTRSAKQKLKKLSGHEKRFSLNQNHIISKMLVNMPYDIFVLEDLKGIRKQKSKGKILNKWMSNWSFWQLEQLLKYKAEALGKQIFKVDARYTSQKCSNCGQIEKNNRNKAHYRCIRCGYYDHSDINSAKNIRNNYLISAAEQQKAEQAMCQLAECNDLKELVTSHQPCAGGN